MWIVLLDHSGSMGDPFEAHPDISSHRLRAVEANIKLAAAKEALLEEIKELGEDVDVVIFGFTSQVHKIFTGKAKQYHEVERALFAVEAANGTDIAAALDAAADYRQQHGGEDVPRIILISDGKSDKTESLRAARRCAKLSMGVHFILIDPTDEGNAFAREVVRPLGGTSVSVTNQSQLKAATNAAREAYAADMAMAEQIIRSSEDEFKAIQQEASDRARLEFTAATPKQISPDLIFPLHVYIYTDAMREELKAHLQNLSEILREMPRTTETESNQLIPIGTQLEITPRINNLTVNPPQQLINWLGDFEEVLFRARYFSSNSTNLCSGFIDITVSGLLIAQIPVSISVGDDKTTINFQQIGSEMLSRIFASYSREDYALIQACKEIYRGLGIQLFVDKSDLLSGQRWREVIRRNIANHDLFQLFWSQTAADSTNVAEEWDLALEISPNKSREFIRPVYWSTPMPPPPNKLAHLNFGFIDIAKLNIEQNTPVYSVTAVKTRQVSSIEVQFPIFNVVEANDNDIKQLQKDLSEVVPFLEYTLGVRYYPPCTFIVDEHFVETLHEGTEPLLPSNQNSSGNFQDIIELLQSLALAFHVGKLCDSENGYNDRELFFDINDNSSKADKADYEHIRYMSEWIFKGPVAEFLAGEDVWTENKKSMLSEIKAVAAGEDSGWDVARMLEYLLEYASTSDAEKVRCIVDENIYKDLKTFEKFKYTRAAQKLLQSNIGTIAAKYKIEKFFHQTNVTTLRLEENFPKYIQAFCAKWLSFIDIALQKRGDVVVDVGFSVPTASLDWLENEFPDIRFRQLNKVESYWNEMGEKCLYELTMSNYKLCVERLSELLLKQLQHRSTLMGATLLPMIASTYGAFLPAHSSRSQLQFEVNICQHGWPKQAALSGQDKILICIGALERLEREMLQAHYLKPEKATELSQRFALSVLVHEHFHAAVATGLDRIGRAAMGAQIENDWAKAKPLNEALAAWIEKHFFRQDAQMTEHINAFITSGDYPIWPYRGAEIIERFYQSGGLPAVRGWIQHLRDDPENALTEFNHQANFLH